MKSILALTIAVSMAASIHAQSQGAPTPAPGAPQTAVVLPSGWRGTRSAQVIEEGGKQVTRLDARPGDGLIWREGTEFKEGTIELDLRGKNLPMQSFVGVAFRVVNATNYDAVYFRPFNFKAENPVNRGHSVQYHSAPDYPWQRLRAEKPEEYEDPVSPVPDPDGWFKAKIVVEGDKITVFVNDSTTPTLTVTALSKQKGGMVGFWVGNNSPGDFANLKITPKP